MICSSDGIPGGISGGIPDGIPDEMTGSEGCPISRLVTNRKADLSTRTSRTDRRMICTSRCRPVHIIRDTWSFLAADFESALLRFVDSYESYGSSNDIHESLHVCGIPPFHNPSRDPRRDGPFGLF